MKFTTNSVIGPSSSESNETDECLVVRPYRGVSAMVIDPPFAVNVKALLIKLRKTCVSLLASPSAATVRSLGIRCSGNLRCIPMSSCVACKLKQELNYEISALKRFLTKLIGITNRHLSVKQGLSEAMNGRKLFPFYLNKECLNRLQQAQVEDHRFPL